MATRHHLVWPKHWYLTETEKMYRQLPCNIVQLGEEVHKLLHTHGFSPRKPPIGEMKEAINRYIDGDCGCVHHELQKRIRIVKRLK